MPTTQTGSRGEPEGRTDRGALQGYRRGVGGPVQGGSSCMGHAAWATEQGDRSGISESPRLTCRSERAAGNSPAQYQRRQVAQVGAPKSKATPPAAGWQTGSSLEGMSALGSSYMRGLPGIRLPPNTCCHHKASSVPLRPPASPPRAQRYVAAPPPPLPSGPTPNLGSSSRPPPQRSAVPSPRCCSRRTPCRPRQTPPLRRACPACTCRHRRR